jgi:hypothetical protein
MRNSFCLAVLFVLTAISLPAEISATDPGWKGFSVRFVVTIEPGRLHPPFREAVIDAGVGNVDAVRRFIDDSGHHQTFGYELKLEPSADGATAQIRIEPLRDAEHAIRNGWTSFGLPFDLPKYPVIPNLRAGDTVAIDLLINPATGQKLVDYLTLERGPSPDRVHDFSLDDILISIDRPRISIDGKLLESTAHYQGGAAGKVVWIHMAGRGAYFFSLSPNQKLGFQKNGMISANTLTFRDGASEFRVECSQPVAPGEGPYNLYVVHKPDWPAGISPVGMGGTGNAEAILGRH